MDTERPLPNPPLHPNPANPPAVDPARSRTPRQFPAVCAPASLTTTSPVTSLPAYEIVHTVPVPANESVSASGPLYNGFYMPMGLSASLPTTAPGTSSLPCAALIAFLFVTQTPAQTQSPPDPGSGLKGLSLEQLGNIEVTTVTREPVSVNRTPAAIYVITQEDIRRSGATSIPEALRLAPGVEVARIDSVKWAIGIRGFESRLSREILVLIDGRTVYDPSFHGVYWEVQDTLIEDIERIEVIRGPGSTSGAPTPLTASSISLRGIPETQKVLSFPRAAAPLTRVFSMPATAAATAALTIACMRKEIPSRLNPIPTVRSLTTGAAPRPDFAPTGK